MKTDTQTNTATGWPVSMRIKPPAPNKAQHSQWFGVYDAQGKLRATFDSEPEAYFYIRNRGHVNGGTYASIEAAQ